MLGTVSNLPSYFSEEIHFGSDIKSIDELNDFILITGYIDTTSESPPMRLAAIDVNGKKVFLKLTQSRLQTGGVSQTYSAKGYVLHLNYKATKVANHSDIYEGHLVVKSGNMKSEYNIVGTAGYH